MSVERIYNRGTKTMLPQNARRSIARIERELIALIAFAPRGETATPFELAHIKVQRRHDVANLVKNLLWFWGE